MGVWWRPEAWWKGWANMARRGDDLHGAPEATQMAPRPQGAGGTGGVWRWLRRQVAADYAPAVALAVVAFVAHMLVADNYGYFRDELYYLVAGQRLAPGYVDFPMMIAALAALTNVVA